MRTLRDELATRLTLSPLVAYLCLLAACGRAAVDEATSGSTQSTPSLDSVVSIGIYSETAPRFRPDSEVFLGTFAGGAGGTIAVQNDTVIKFEQKTSLRSTVRAVGSADYAGWFVSWGSQARAQDDSFTRDLSMFADGSLHFALISPRDLVVGIRSGDVHAGDETSKVRLSRVGFVPSGVWQPVCISLKTFVGRAPLADLTKVKVLFTIAVDPTTGGTGSGPLTFWVDDVRWDKRAC